VRKQCNFYEKIRLPTRISPTLVKTLTWHQKVDRASSSFEPVAAIHCLAALDLGAGVEQPFSCLIIPNRQAVQFMVRSMDWTFEDDIVGGCSEGPYPICVSKSGNVRHGGGQAGLTLFLDNCRRVGAGVGVQRPPVIEPLSVHR